MWMWTKAKQHSEGLITTAIVLMAAVLMVLVIRSDDPRSEVLPQVRKNGEAIKAIQEHLGIAPDER